MMSDHEWDLYLRGCDSHETIRAEMEDCYAEDCISSQDEMETRGGPAFRPSFSDEIPF